MKTFEPTSKKPSLFFVPGDMSDPELISLKAHKAIAAARVVLYDRSVHPDLLRLVNAECRVIDITHYADADLADKITVFYAYRYGIAVRLYSEEFFNHDHVDYARKRNIDVHVVPSVPGSLSVPVSQGIPPTRRGANESLWMAPYISTLDKVTLNNLLCVARSGAAIILRTRYEYISAISVLFKSVRGDDEPAAILADGNCIRGTVSTICESFRPYKEKTVIVVIGKTAAEKLDFSVHPVFNLAI